MLNTDDLQEFLTGVADAIRTKKGTTDPIPAPDFDTEILSIVSGDIDMTDSTATKYDILSPQVAYTKEGRVVGEIVPTTSDDVTSALEFKFTSFTIEDINSIVGFRIRKEVMIYYTDTQIGLFYITNPYDIMKYNMSDLDLVGVTAVDISVNDGRILISLDGTHRVYLLNGLEIVSDAGYAEIVCPYINFNDSYPNMLVGATLMSGSNMGPTNAYIFGETGLTYTTKILIGGAWTTYEMGRGNPQGPTLTVRNTSSDYWTIRKFDDAGNAIWTVPSRTYTVPKYSLSSPDAEYINFSYSSSNKHNFRKLSVSGSEVYRTFTFAADSMGYYADNGLVFFVNTDGVNIYSIELNIITDTIETTLNPTKTFYFDAGHKFISLVENEFKICYTEPVQNYTELKRLQSVYYNPYKEMASSDKVLSGETFVNFQGRQVGVMPNNGELVYSPSDVEQTIPAGYTSGGKINATDITLLNNYIVCDTLAQNILGENVKYRALEYITFTGTQYFNTGIALWSKENWRMEYTFDISSKFNYNHLWSLTDGAEAWESWVYSSGEYCRRLNGNKVTVDTLTTNTKYVFSHQYSDVNALSPDLNLIFGRRYGTSDGIFKGKLYSVKMWVDDVLVRDFIPVMDLDGVKAMYDLVEQKFYYSANEPFV